MLFFFFEGGRGSVSCISSLLVLCVCSDRETVFLSFGLGEEACLSACAFKEYHFTLNAVPYPSEAFMSYVEEYATMPPKDANLYG